MDETFEQRPLLDRGTLRSLQQREDISSFMRLTLQLGAFMLGGWFVVVVSPSPVDNRARSYWQLQLDVLRQRNLPNGIASR